MADTIRDIVLRVAIEQKQVVLKAPDFKPMVAAAQSAGVSAADAISAKMDAGIAAVESDLKKLEVQLNKNEKAAEQYAAKAAQMEQKIQAQTSATISAYAEGATAALQFAKGVAFVSAANEKDAEAMVRTIAKYQGYFDILVGGTHLLKSFNDIQRQTSLLLTLTAASEAAVAASSAPAAAGLTSVAAAGTAVTVSLGPISLIAVGVAAAGCLMYQNWKYWSDLAKADLIPSADVMTNKLNVMATAAQNAAQAAAATAGARGSNRGSGDSSDTVTRQMAAVKQLTQAQAVLGERREFIEASALKRERELEQQRRSGRLSEEDYLKEVQANQEIQIKLRREDLTLEQQKQQLIESSIKLREEERERLQSITQASQQALIVEENRNRSENVRLGLLTRGQQAQVKALLDKKASGAELSESDIRRAQKFGVLGSSVEAFGQKQADQSGITASRKAAGETSALENAKRNADADRRVFEDAADDIDKSITALRESNLKAVNRIAFAFQALAKDQVTFDDLATAIEKIQRENKNQLQIGRKN